MSDQIDKKKLSEGLVKTIKEAIEVYSLTVKEIRSRELKKATLCLLCGNEDKPGKCTCVSLSKSDKQVQGAMAVADKPEPGAVLPGDKKSKKDKKNDEGSGGDLVKGGGLAGLISRAAGKPPKMDAQTGARIDAIATDRTKDVINAPKVKATGLPGMKKVSVEEANRELQGAKSIASSPVMPGGKMANPNAMSPGKGPKPVSGEIKKAELIKVLGACAVCKNDEHIGNCK